MVKVGKAFDLGKFKFPGAPLPGTPGAGGGQGGGTPLPNLPPVKKPRRR